MPQRLASPFQFGQAVLEPIVQPVYDSIELTAATPNGQFRFFVDPTGKTAREIFPGITTGGQLSAPRMAVVYGVRLHVDEDIADATQVADMKNIVYNSFLTFTVGIKDYAVAPFFWFASGLGLSGFQGAALATGSVTNGVPAFHSHFSIAKRRIAIPPQQQFSALLTVAGAAVLAEDTEIWCFLDTEFGQYEAAPHGDVRRKHRVNSGNPATGIPSQAAEGNGSAEGVTTRSLSPNNNATHERPTTRLASRRDSLSWREVNRQKSGIKSPGGNTTVRGPVVPARYRVAA